MKLFSFRLLPLAPKFRDRIAQLWKQEEISKRDLFSRATESELDDLVKGLKKLGFKSRMPTKETGAMRVKINDETWEKLGERAREVGLDRTALLLVCVGRFLNADISK